MQMGRCTVYYMYDNNNHICNLNVFHKQDLCDVDNDLGLGTKLC